MENFKEFTQYKSVKADSDCPWLRKENFQLRKCGNNMRRIALRKIVWILVVSVIIVNIVRYTIHIVQYILYRV